MPREGLNPEVVTRAAATIVDVHGPAALTLARLAAELGVAAPSLYKHVDGLDDLILRVSTLSTRRMADELTMAAVASSGRDALLSIATAYRRFAIEHTGLYALAQVTLKHGSDAQRAEASRALKVFEAVVRSYGVPDDLVIHAIRVVRAGLHGFTDLEARGGFQLSQSMEDSFLVLVDALHASLSKLGHPERGRAGA